MKDELRANVLWSVCLLLVVATPLLTPLKVFGQSPGVYSVDQFYNLTNEEARDGTTIRLEGTILYSDPAWGLLWLQDETGRIFIPVSKEQSVPPARTEAVLTGKIELIGGTPQIVDFQFQTLGPAELPPPKMVTPLNMLGKKQTHSRALGSGTVIQAEMKDDQHITLVVAFLRRFQFRVTINNCNREDLDGLLGAHVEVTGCATQFSGVDHPKLAKMQMFVPDMSDVAVFQRGPADVFDAPQIKLSETETEYRSRRDPRLVRITATVDTQPDPNSIVLVDGDARLTVLLRDKMELEPDSQVDVVGIIWKDEEQEALVLDYAQARPALAPELVDSEPSDQLPVLHTVQSVRGLTPEMAAQKFPVEIRGIVTYYDPVWRVLFVNDETGGIYVNEKSQVLPIQIGDRVLARGVSDPGGFASMVAAGRVQRIGSGQLPDSRTVPAARVLSGAEDGQWLTLTATVASVERSQQNLVLNLHGIEKNYPFQAVICSSEKYVKSRNWVGSEIRITGVCGTKANSNRQAVGVYFHVPSIDHVEFLHEVNDDPFEVPQVAIADLLKFDSDAEERLQQAKISGVVTYSDAFGQIAIQDDDQGILLRFKDAKRPQIGDQIEVTGYPILNSTQRLQVTAWRRLGSGKLPVPRPIEVTEIVDHGLDGQYVALEALLLRNNAASVTPGLSLQSRGMVFAADLSSATTDGQWAKLQDGSTIRLEGVLDVLGDDWSGTQSFRLLCPSASTVEVTQPAPWWNSAYARMLVAALAFLVLAGVTWAITLRRSVNVQRDQIQSELMARAKLTERYNTLVENAGELIFSIKPDGEFVSANAATVRVLQATAPDLDGCQFSDFLTSKSVQALHDAIGELSVERLRAQLELTTRDNVILETAVYLEPSESSTHEIQCIARDVSERRRLENQMRHMQKMESIGQLAAGIAHDYNNLMTVVLCNSEILLGFGELKQHPTESVCQIKDAAERAASLTRQLLAFSRRQIMSMTVFPPKDLLLGLADMLQRLIGESIQLECEFEDDVPQIQADRGMLEQVIVNLAVNARDAMPRGGRLGFALSNYRVVPDSPSENINLSPGDYVEISVSDSGCGIPADDIANVFEPFFTSKEVGKGTGLGLSTAFGIIRQHKGWIDVESTIDVGTTFTILLPVAITGESNRFDTQDYRGDERPRGGEETILVVEDDPSVRRSTKKLLSLAGYKIIEAENGRDALETWHRLKHGIDLTITDMIMPGGLSGYDMAQEMKSISPETRLIYCSGYSHEISKLSALDPTERLLPKPYESQALLQVVRELLDVHATVKS